MDTLETVWFLLVCVLFCGYFVLEGFDYGVALLWRVVGRSPAERRMVIHTIGPWWDGNQVWLITAGGALFAAFPGWYGALFAGFYLPLLLILIGLVLRGVAFEFWGKHDAPGWRTAWEWAATGGSALPALLWGVAWANVIRGVPMTAQHDVTASLPDLLNPYALLGGVTSLVLFVAHGAAFLGLRLGGEPLVRARRVGRVATPAAALLVVAFLAWTVAARDGVDAAAVVLAVVAVVAAGLGAGGALLPDRATARRAAGTRFGLGVLTIVAFFGAQFAVLAPRAIVGTDATNTLTLADAASSHYTLTVMTVVAVVLLPVVLGYQAWSFWVLRHRLDPEHYDLPKVELQAFGDPRLRDEAPEDRS